MSETANPEEELTESTAEAARDDADSALASNLSDPESKSDVEPEYRLADPEPSPTPSAAPPPSPEAIESTFEATADESDQPLTDEFPAELPDVSEVWSRWAEWRVPLLWSGAGIGLATLIYVGRDYVALLMFLMAMAYGAYCIIISLEVPVRVTPEQAVKEFYGAACHRLPNFRRMFSLLTRDGRQCDAFSGFADFRAYWAAQIARLSRSPAWLIPLEFRIEGFKYRHNAEKSMAVVRYILKVSPRGRPESEEPTARMELHNLVVKGPDGQWYLNDGTLPEAS